jgi:hypothetical protein
VPPRRSRVLTELSDYLFVRSSGHIGSFITLTIRGCCGHLRRHRAAHREPAGQHSYRRGVRRQSASSCRLRSLPGSCRPGHAGPPPYDLDESYPTLLLRLRQPRGNRCTPGCCAFAAPRDSAAAPGAGHRIFRPPGGSAQLHPELEDPAELLRRLKPDRPGTRNTRRHVARPVRSAGLKTDRGFCYCTACLHDSGGIWQVRWQLPYTSTFQDLERVDVC